MSQYFIIFRLRRVTYIINYIYVIIIFFLSVQRKQILNILFPKLVSLIHKTIINKIRINCLKTLDKFN